MVLYTSFYSVYVLCLQGAVNVFVLLALLVAADRVLNLTKYLVIKARAKLTGRTPQLSWYFKPLPEVEDLYPKVAIQLPMFNERAVCQAIIDCCAELNWPAQSFKIQVLDDSTDKVTRELVDEKVLEWRERGINVDCVRRTNRQGYKAGAMKEGMELLAREGYEYVAVFDADFKPEADFLEKTIPYLEGNPEVGFVQTRWVFTNPQESYLTKAQEIGLNYHMKAEQYTHSAVGSFFNFNGTAGVWRRSCIETSGGWNSRTTVEDMDLSLRAYIRGWKAIFLDDVTCLNELPASFFAYRKQQHRWTCGPIQLWSKAAKDIKASKLPALRKLELVWMYFGVRKCATHFVSLGLFCGLVPLTMFTPEVHVPTWALVHLPVAVTLSTAAFTPRGWVYSILFVLFENAMGPVKLWAVINGLMDLQRAQEWVVTTKLGSSDKRPHTAGASKLFIPSCKIWGAELVMAAFVLTAAAYGLLSGMHWGMSAFLLFQGLVFMAFGFNWVDCGGLLGGRLDEDIVRVPTTISRRNLASVTRSATVSMLPVIDIASHERVPLSKHASALGRLQTANSISVLDAYESGSPTHSSGSSGTRTPDDSSERSGSEAAGPAMLKLDRWQSPNSSLANIYVPSKAAAARKPALAGWLPSLVNPTHAD